MQSIMYAGWRKQLAVSVYFVYVGSFCMSAVQHGEI